MKKIDPAQINSFSAFIKNHDFFYIAGHKEPDGDCIASCMGISYILQALGKNYQLLSAGPFKRVEIQPYEHLFASEALFLSEADRKRAALIICDCSEPIRLGEIDGDLHGLDTFIIDHHKTSSCPAGAEGIIDPSAPAASILVQLLYEGVVGAVPQEAAEILFFGLMTDSGFFRFLTPDDAEIFSGAARLVHVGVSPRKTYDLMTGGKSWTSRKLLGLMLDHAERHLDGKLAIAYETQEETRKWGQEGRDSDMLYSALLSVKGVEAAVFVRQETDASCTIGFRSKDRIDVSAVAAKFGGGGHKNAAGCSTQGKINTLIPVIIKEFARQMQNMA